MRRVVLALDVQERFQTPQMVVQGIQSLAGKYPLVATLFTHEENDVPFDRLVKWKGPIEDSLSVQTEHVYNRHGYHLPIELLALLKENQIDEVYITGGKNETFLITAATDLFDIGIKPSMVAPLCLTGQFHQMSVLMRMWEQNLGGVYENTHEL
jgi:nicotinamidase-related amidase